MKLTKTVLMTASAAVLVMNLTACTPGNNTPGSTLTGAAAGGLIGGLLSRGSGFGIVAGALVGGAAGYIVGRQMDAQDRANMQAAIINTPVDEDARWTNERTNMTYVVTPVENYHSNGMYCRRYKTRIFINGRWETAFGRACKGPNGNWRIMS